MTPHLRPCAVLIVAIGGAAAGRAAQANDAGLTPPDRAATASSAATATPPGAGEALTPSGPLMATPPSPAPSPRDELDAERESRARYAAGEAAFKAGRYPQAVLEFDAGFAAVPKPGFLLNIGHAYRRLGDLHKARAAYKKFLLVDPTSDLHEDVLSLISQLDSALADDDRSDRLAARAIAAALVPPPLDVHGGHAGLDLAAPAPAAVSLGEQAPRPFYRRAWFWTAVGTVAIGTGIGIYAVRGSADEKVHTTGSLGVLKP